MTKPVTAPCNHAGLHNKFISMVESARRTVQRDVNAVMTAAYREIEWRRAGSEQGSKARQLRAGRSSPVPRRT